jgi:ribosomal-protein-alanine N-acetyltransferase
MTERGSESAPTSPAPRIATARLLLRPFVPSDAPTVERLVGAREVADTVLSIPHPYPAGAAAAWIAEHEPMWAAGRRLTLAVCVADAPDDVVGAIGIALVAEHARGELGYWIAADVWGRGYATEAARAVVAYGFEGLGLNRIQAQHFVRNPASGRVMQKIGMRFEGVHRQMFRRWDRFEDSAVYAILASDAATAPMTDPGVR